MAYIISKIAVGLTWSEAADLAEAKGGQLASLSTAAENQIILDALARSGDTFFAPGPDGEQGGPWIGLVQAQVPDADEPENGWSWLDGSTFSDFGWLDGQPDDFDGVDRGAFVRVGGATGWGDQLDDPTDAGEPAITSYVVELASTVLTGTAGSDYIIADNVVSTLRGGSGADFMVNPNRFASAPYCTFYVDDVGDVVLGKGRIFTTVDYTLLAGQFQDLRSSSSSGLRLEGNEFPNTFVSGEGIDTLIGGANRDVYFVNDTADVVHETVVSPFNTEADYVYASVDYALGTGEAIERLYAFDTDASLRLTGNEIANSITGGVGDDTLDGGVSGSDSLAGRGGDDVYIVDRAGLFISELVDDGRDEVRASIDYTLTGNLDDLTLRGDAVNGTGNAFDNTLVGNSRANMLRGLAGNDRLDGGAKGADSLYGDDGDDTLDGGAKGADMLFGGDGDDVYLVDHAGVFLTELADEGLDEVIASVGVILTDEIENLTLIGKADVNGTGNGLANVILGNKGGNGLIGGGGDDRLTGGGGRDRLVGGEGDDTFIYAAVSDSKVGAGRDVISGFVSGEDTIKLTDIDAVKKSAGDQAFDFIGAGAFSGAAGQLRAYVSGANTIVEGNVNRDGVADFQIVLTGVVALQETDFLL